MIIGAARQGMALARFLSIRGAQVILNDQRDASQMSEAIHSLSHESGIQWALGGHPLTLLNGIDLVCVSGGVSLSLPILRECSARGIPLTNDSQIFFEAVTAPVIGITGSAGKTTTTTLVGRMANCLAETTHRKAWVGGNIGLPLVEYVDQINPQDLVVVELSSFQLEQMTCSPQVSAVLNITPNHLDRHGAMEVYTAAKARILDFQNAASAAVLNREDSGAWELRERVKGRLVTFGLQKPRPGLTGTYIENNQVCLAAENGSSVLLDCAEILLRGEHNRLNVLAACAVAYAAGWPAQVMRAGIHGFTGVAHRLELIGERHQAAWYNDSIATTPERAIAAVQSFDEPLVLLLGGRDKNLPWQRLAELVHQRVDHVIVFGQAAGLIRQALGPLQSGDRLQSIDCAQGLRDAVQTAAAIVEPGDVVLLSPGGTSFDEFKDFEERGERFREWVKELS